MVVTKEFCKPIANSKLKAMRSGLLVTKSFPKNAITNKIKHSIEAQTI